MTGRAVRVEVVDPFPGRVPWPCGRRPYRKTVRAWHYRNTYWLPRLALWAYVVVPPLIAGAWWASTFVTTESRLLIEAAVLLGTVVLAVLLDLALFAPIFHGRGGAPGILHAADCAAAWREDWLALEAQRGVLPDVALSLHDVHTYSIPNFDAAPLLQQQKARERFERAIREGFRQLNIVPIFGAGFTERYGTLLIIWPLPEPASSHATVWLLAHLLNNADNDSCRLTSGYTYWRTAGHVPGTGWHRGDEATLKYVLPFTTVFSPKGLFVFVLVLLATLLWPIGVLVLIGYAVAEMVLHGRYKEFLRTADPRFGDSLDLALLCQAAQDHAEAFAAKPDVVTSERLRDAARHFEHVVTGALLASAGCGAS